MTSSELREKYLLFFEKKGHKRIAPAPLVLEGDSSTLFTSAGMQPLVPYLKGKKHPDGDKLVNSQPCFRSQDIDEVGDNRHTTFFEMLGNWSLGDYFKKEQLGYFWEFLTEELKLPKEKLYVSVFAGDKDIEKDNESRNIWKSLGVSEDHIFEYGFKKNWWSLYGSPENMPVGEIGGPDSEVFFDFGEELGLHEKYEQLHDRVLPCHPNCDCGRFLEIGNSVFIQYIKREDGSLEELPQKNVDFGGGLERLTAAVNNDPDVFKIDTFSPLIQVMEEITGKNYSDNTKFLRRIADHTKAAVFIIAAGIEPSNTSHGYVLRRLIRRVLRFLYKLETDSQNITKIAELVIQIYADTYPDLQSKSELISKILTDEAEKFKEPINDLELYKQNLEAAINKILIKKIGSAPIINEDGKASGLYVFENYQSYGVPPDLSEDIVEELGLEFDKKGFEQAMREHQGKSRSTSAGMFKGGLAGDTPTMRKYHTTAHLLQAALRKVLGEHVEQKGQNITDERLRFDFKHDAPVTDIEKDKVEEIINEQIQRDLPVISNVMNVEEALDSGALGFFRDKYGEQVSVYTIGDPESSSGLAPFSREVCGGPHVTHTGEIGHVTITKEEAVSAGVRRIYIKLG